MRHISSVRSPSLFFFSNLKVLSLTLHCNLSLQISKITFEKPMSEIPDWDDRIRSVRWVDVSTTVKRSSDGDTRSVAADVNASMGFFSLLQIVKWYNNLGKQLNGLFENFRSTASYSFQAAVLQSIQCSCAHKNASFFSISWSNCLTSMVCDE